MRALCVLCLLVGCNAPSFLVVSLAAPAQTTAPEIDTLEVTVSAQVDGANVSKVLSFDVVNQSLPVSFFLEFDPEQKGLEVELLLSGQKDGVEVLFAQGQGQVGDEVSLAAQFCGDFVLQPGEQCDDGNTAGADGCNPNCTLPACGNGVFDPGEICFGAPQVLVVGGEPFLLKTGDFNVDGILDLASLNQESATVSILLGNGDGTFQDQVATIVLSNPTDFEVGKLNPDDAFPDLVVVNNSRTVNVLFGDGDGRFSTTLNLSVNSTEFAGAVVATDINRDNLDDIIVSGRVNDVFGATVSAFINRTTAVQNILFDPHDVFSQDIGQVVGLVSGDVTGDFSNDLVAAILSGQVGNTVEQLRILENTNNPFTLFEAPTLVSNAGMAAEIDTLIAADIDADGALDLLTLQSDPTQDIAIFTGQGDGQFNPVVHVEVSNTLTPSALAVDDLNADSTPDLVVALEGISGQEEFVIMTGQGATFSAPVSFSVLAAPASIVTGDFNLDGFEDVALAHNILAGVVSVFLFEP